MKKRLFQLASFISLGLLLILLGAYTQQKHVFPGKAAMLVLDNAKIIFRDIFFPWFYYDADLEKHVSKVEKEKMQPGLTMLTRISDSKKLAITIVDHSGNQIHEYPINWYQIWEDKPFLARSTNFLPAASSIHGSHIFDNGDVVFNFEYKGMVKLNACGKVIWKLNELTHHSIYVDDENTIWTSINSDIDGKRSGHELYRGLMHLPLIARVSSDGKVLFKKSISKLLEDNGLEGVLYLSTTENFSPIVNGDTLHMNDVEVFPATMNEGFFKHGDVMVSLRNANAIIIFDPKNWSVKHTIFNLTLRQHDPDFQNGNTITVYDNNNQFKPESEKRFSEILEISIPDNTVRSLFKGSRETPFFSPVLGKHQLLDNGNILIAEGTYGRVIEVTPSGEIVWDYTNIVEPGTKAAITGAERLKPHFDKAFFAGLQTSCPKSNK